MDSKPINYLYFLGAFSFLVLLVASSIFTKNNLGGSHFFFFLYAVGQVILEVALCIFVSMLIRRYLGAFCFALFIGATFVVLILHLLDFMVNRILDLSIWEAFRIFVFDESWENFVYLLDASGVPIWGWAALLASFVALPFIGIFLYNFSDRIAQKKPLELHNGHFLQAFVCIPFALLFWDFSASKVIHPDAYTSFIKSLPWKYTFFQPESAFVALPGPMRMPMSEEAVMRAIQEEGTVLEKRPNIYLFVVESLREDAITAEIAPILHQFKNGNVHFDRAISNANGTQISWFSIFHSQFPYFWKHFQSRWKTGSPALQMLKKWGYQIRLYSSAQLGYYGMERLLFGDQLQLIDSRQNFHHAAPLNAADSDAMALEALQKDMAANPALHEGQVFIIFWDCTHFDYSWPKSWQPKFAQFAQESTYFSAFQSEKTIGLIKNRYHNAVNYMDCLFGNFLQKLPLREEAVIVFTGDHGEEFFEQGHLFHNSHLTEQQTHIPLYLKLGMNTRALQERAVASQMDIFPTILDYISKKQITFLEGNSLFQKPKWPCVITARFNAGRTPYEFSIHNGRNKLIAQFPDRTHIFDSKHLQILSLRTHDDQTIPEFKYNLDNWVQTEFGAAIEHLCIENISSN